MLQLSNSKNTERTKITAPTLLLCIVLAGCGGMKNTNSTNTQSKPAWSYGNFCGGNYPQTHNQHRPIDDLDTICYYHDLCYDLANGPSYICDMALADNLENFIKGLPPPRRCASITAELVVFASSNITPDKPGVLTAIETFNRVLQAPFFAVLSGVLHEGSQYAPQACNYSPRTPGTPLMLVAPRTNQELTYMRECQRSFEEDKIQPYGSSDRNRKLLTLIGPKKPFRNRLDYDLRRGCVSYPLTQLR